MLGKIEDRRRRGQQRMRGITNWHYQLDVHEFEQAPGVGNGQGCLAAAIDGITKSRTQLSN